jgi:hypothetical protein
MEKLRLYIAPASRLRPKYAELAQSSADEHDVCPSCGHVQNEAPQALHSSISRAWLALWTIATALFGILIVSILLLAKQYTFHCLGSASLLSDQAFPERMFTPGRRYREQT